MRTTFTGFNFKEDIFSLAGRKVTENNLVIASVKYKTKTINFHQKLQPEEEINLHSIFYLSIVPVLHNLMILQEYNVCEFKDQF